MIQPHDLNVFRYDIPTPQYPYYHLRLRLEADAAPGLSIRQVRVDGRRSRDFWVYRAGCPTPYGDQLTGAPEEDLVLRLDWSNGSAHRVKVDVEGADGAAITLTAEATAPERGGWWHGDWRYYASVVVRETAGLARTHEPVHVLLGLYTDRLTDPAREVRVIGINPASGAPCETPCQVYDISVYDAESDQFNQPTTTFEVAFLADVPASAEKVYLIFYGNPDAPSPQYTSDLRVSGEALAFTIDNDYYRARLHTRAGTLDDVLLKGGVNTLFEHHVENNGALHWNPGVYTRERRWAHQSDWDPPPVELSYGGPVFFMTRRSGALPSYPEVLCTVTYTFYAHQPYIMMSSSLDIIEDIDVHALRSGEAVFNHKVVREFAWKQPGGEIGSVAIYETPKSPRLGLYMERDVPWWAFYNRDLEGGFAGINLEVVNIQRDKSLIHWEPYTYLYWSDELIYCCRPLVYTFSTGPWNNPQRMMRIPRGSTYYERMAFYPFRLGRTQADRFAPIEDTYRRLAFPLDVSVANLDIDARVPDGWARPEWLQRDDYTRPRPDGD
ncbi:MAG: hypothetical protein HXY41_11880 [Chloroflexi bacterium]|nr:hypothetical protein [Chloroflexota bacterium]